MYGGGAPLRRRRTLQGGTGQALTYGGTPNAPAQGITQQYLGGNPTGGFGSPSIMPVPQPGGTGRSIMPVPKPVQGLPGFNNPFMPNRGGPGGGVHLPGLGAKGGPGGKVGGPGGGGQGQGTGGGHGQGWGAKYHALLRKLGLPLDPQFLAQQTGARNSRDMLLTQLMNTRDTGNAQLDYQSVLGNRQIDENTAARGMFGSGIEKRDERLLGQDIGGQRQDLLSQFSQGQLGARMDYRQTMMQAMLDLAKRAQGQKHLPLPYGRRPGKGGGGKGGGKKGGGGGGKKGGGVRSHFQPFQPGGKQPPGGFKKGRP